MVGLPAGGARDWLGRVGLDLHVCPPLLEITPLVGHRAKLVAGLSDILPPGDLTVIANTGDDFEYLGLHISPDIDSVFYALAGWNDTERGWGRAGETWQCMAALGQLNGETWFNLGDQDLALHLERTRRLRSGETLSEVTTALSNAAGIATRIVPMSDTPVPTIVQTANAGDLAFQHYFVRERCMPVVTGFMHKDADQARLPEALRSLADVEAAHGFLSRCGVRSSRSSSDSLHCIHSDGGRSVATASRCIGWVRMSASGSMAGGGGSARRSASCRSARSRSSASQRAQSI